MYKLYINKAICPCFILILYSGPIINEPRENIKQLLDLATTKPNFELRFETTNNFGKNLTKSYFLAKKYLAMGGM